MKCSIVGYMPIGFCCENCYLYDEYRTCLKSKSKAEEIKKQESEGLGEIKLLDVSIEGQLLRVAIDLKDGEEKIILLDLKKYLES